MKRVSRWLWQLQGFIWTTLIAGVFVNLGTTWLLSKGFDLQGTPLGWFIEHPWLLGSFAFLIFGQTIFAWWGRDLSIAQSSAQQPINTTTRKNVLSALRNAYSDELDTIFQSMSHITLSIQEHFDLTHPMRLISQHSSHSVRDYPEGTSIVDIFNEAGQGLLILGDPGVGKTVMLYELAQALAIRAEGDITYPLPVLLNLSSWAGKQLSLRTWIVKELELRYLIPQRLGARWLDEQQLLVLLDGLDEVAQKVYFECIDAINDFQVNQIHPLALRPSGG